MTIGEAIKLLDARAPNLYSAADKKSWLKNFDMRVWNELISTHWGAPHHAMPDYDDTDTELLIPAPYAEDVYNYYLQAQVAQENAEGDKYNELATMFNAAYQSYCNFYNRTHMPRSQRRWRF